MNSLNYHHLRYFWAVARHGGVRQASRVLHVTQPTISEQVRQLEESLGVSLFRRDGRRLKLTERGETVYRYAESIFTIGDELVNALADRPPGHTRRYVIGVADVLPKMAAVKLLEPVLTDATVRLVVQEDPPDRLLGRLESRVLDAVLSDAPARPSIAPRAISHLLGVSSISLFARADLAERYKPGFPGNLDDAPILLPQLHNSLRQSLDRWFRTAEIRPDTVAECDDSAMIKSFGADGFGMFPAPSIVADEICEQYNVRVVGVIPDVFERFFLLYLENRQEDPATRAIRIGATLGLFEPRASIERTAPNQTAPNQTAANPEAP